MKIKTLKISEIRDFLLKNPQYFSNKNNCNISEIKSGKKYWFHHNCGHETFVFPQNTIHNNGSSCNICLSRTIVKGINNINFTHPHIAKYLKNKEDGDKYSINSNKKLEWKCINCGNIWETSPNKISKKSFICSVCGKGNSYGERYIYEMLSQLCIAFEKEKNFFWSDKKRYDFYIPFYDCIIEINGKQHYSETSLTYLGARTLYEEQENDKEKRKLALKNGIKHYIYIDCSSNDRIKENILKSDLQYILQFFPDEIEWEECEKYALGSRLIEICDCYNNTTKKLTEIANIVGCSRTTVLTYLKYGNKLKLCDYTVEIANEIANKNNGIFIIKNMSKPVVQLSVDGKFINKYDSIQEAQRILGISHIWDCIKGKRKTAGGYKWIYYKDYI